MIAANLRKSGRRPPAAVTFCIALVATQVAMAHLAGWKTPDTDGVLSDYTRSLSYVQWAAWLCVEGGWAVVGLSAFVLMRRGMFAHATLLGFSVVLAMAAAAVVSLLAPNCDIVRGVAMTWLIPLPPQIAITMSESPADRSNR